MDDGSKGTPSITVGVDLGDRYSYLCFLDTESGEVIEEGRLCAPPPKLSGAASLRDGYGLPDRFGSLKVTAPVDLVPFLRRDRSEDCST